MFLEWRQRPNFAYPLQVADDTNAKNCLISIFEQFLQTSHNLRIFKGQNHMSGEKTPLQNCFQAMRSRTDKTIGHLTEVRTPRRLKKN